MKTLIALAAIPALALTAAPAMAGEAHNTVKVAVSDIDLTTEEGAAELDRRVRKAAFKACMYDQTGMLVTPEKHVSCQRAAMKKSEGQVATIVANARYGG